MAVARLAPDRPLTQDELCERYGDRIYKFAVTVGVQRAWAELRVELTARAHEEGA